MYLVMIWKIIISDIFDKHSQQQIQLYILYYFDNSGFDMDILWNTNRIIDISNVCSKPQLHPKSMAVSDNLQGNIFILSSQGFRKLEALD